MHNSASRMPKNTIGKWGEELNSPQSAAIFIARCASPTASRLNARTIAYSLSHPKCTENGCLERFLDAMILSGKALLRTKRLPLTAKKPPKIPVECCPDWLLSVSILLGYCPYFSRLTTMPNPIYPARIGFFQPTAVIFAYCHFV